jgi:Domain of unknown function (DUF4386)
VVAGGYEMAISTIDKSQRTAARIARLAFPISFAIVVAVNFGIFARLIGSGNPAETARNILAHETLFRVGIAGDMVYCVGVVVLLTALYVILKPVNQNLALLAAFGRLVHGLTWLLATLNLFTALRLLRDADYSRALGPDQLPVTHHHQCLHAFVIWPAAAFRYHPIYDLIRIGDITRLAVHAIGGVDF